MNSRVLRLNEQLVTLVTYNVLEIFGAGPTLDKALDLARQAHAWADSLIERFEADNPLPYPIACRPGCDFCCHNQIEVTPLEALAIGSHIQALPAEEQAVLQDRIKASLASRAGKTKVKIARSRREFPCPFLSQGLCAIYPVRPLLCRAMHSLDAGRCQESLLREHLTPDRYYLHRDEIVRSVIKGLTDGCQSVGCQAASLDLAQALDRFLAQPEQIMQAWLQGKELH
jgi:Fe-S-cluster containining protein